jgi:WD40 repeat protein
MRRRFRLLLGALVLLSCGGAVGPSPAASARPKAPVPRRPQPRIISADNVERLRLGWEAAVGGFGRAVAVHRGASKVFVVTDRVAAAYDLASGERVADVALCGEVLRGGLAVQGDELWAACKRGLARLDAHTLTPKDAVEPVPVDATAAAFAPGSVALGHRDGVVRIYPLSGGPLREVPVPGPPIDVKALALSSVSDRVAVAWIQGSVWWWDIGAPDRSHRLVRHDHESDALAFDPSGRRLAEEGEVEHTAVWDLETAEAPVAKLENGDWVKRIHFTPDGKWLARGGSDGLELAEIAGPKRIALDTSGDVEDVASDEAFSSLAAIDRKGRLTFWTLP